MTIFAKIVPQGFRSWQAGRMEVLTPRDVPLGGLRAMTVRRTLPQRQRSLIGAWCFLDHYGPDEVDGSGGMVVPPHPHTGLQTVSCCSPARSSTATPPATTPSYAPGSST
jgi:hypothetical protein